MPVRCCRSAIKLFATANDWQAASTLVGRPKSSYVHPELLKGGGGMANASVEWGKNVMGMGRSGLGGARIGDNNVRHIQPPFPGINVDLCQLYCWCKFMLMHCSCYGLPGGQGGKCFLTLRRPPAVKPPPPTCTHTGYPLQ